MLLFIMKPHHTSCWVLYWISPCAHPKFTHIYRNSKNILFQLSQVCKCLSMMKSDQFLYVLTKSQWISTSHLNFVNVNISVSPQSMKTWLLWKFGLKAWRWGSVGYEDVLWLDSYVAIDEVSLSEWLSVRVCVSYKITSWSLFGPRERRKSVMPFTNWNGYLGIKANP